MAKDFLEQFSNEGKPASFQKEERIAIVKEKKQVPIGLIICLIITIIAIGVGYYFLFLSPKIEMPNFIGKSKNDVSDFIKQYSIKQNGIVIKEEYNFEQDKDNVISQSIEAGKKVDTNLKLTLVISKGADPQEKISLPDIKSMNKQELEDWILENKLTNTKISTTYSNEVEADKVISYQVGSQESEFTRGTSLTISISKGIEESVQVKVVSLIGKTADSQDVTNWINNNKLKLKKENTYSNTVQVGEIVSQNPQPNTIVSSNSTITVYVSQGKGVNVVDLISMNYDEAKNWVEDNKAVLNIVEKYTNGNPEKYVYEQSLKAGSIIGGEEKMSITVNLGNFFYFNDEIGEIDYVNRLEDKLNSLRSKGIDAYVLSESSTYVFSSEPKGKILSIQSITSHSTGQTFTKQDRLPLDARFSLVISKGKEYIIKIGIGDDTDNINYSSGTKFNKTQLINLLSAKSISFSVESNQDDVELYINGVVQTGTEIKFTDEDKVVLK